MNKIMSDTSLFDKAVIYATQAHSGTLRRGKAFPYLIHPLEAAVIISEVTSDPEILAAAVLHDVIEDTSTTYEDICNEFGKRIANLVISVSDIVPEHQDGLSRTEIWRHKKLAYIERLSHSEHDVKLLAIGDKLSNMRAIARDYSSMGDSLWSTFKAGSREALGWYYTSLVDVLDELYGLAPYDEFRTLVGQIFHYS